MPMTAAYAFSTGAPPAHGTLAGLGADDHAQYGLLAGRAGGQIFNGGTGAGDALTLIGSSGGTDNVLVQADGGAKELQLLSGAVLSSLSGGAGGLNLLGGTKAVTLNAVGGVLLVDAQVDGVDILADGAAKSIRMNAGAQFNIYSDTEIRIQSDAGGAARAITLNPAGDIDFGADAGGFNFYGDSGNQQVSWSAGGDFDFNSGAGGVNFNADSGARIISMQTGVNALVIASGAAGMALDAAGGAKSLHFTAAGSDTTLDGGADGFEINADTGAQFLRFKPGLDALLSSGAQTLDLDADGGAKYLHLVSGGNSLLNAGAHALEIYAVGNAKYLQFDTAGNLTTLDGGADGLLMQADTTAKSIQMNAGGTFDITSDGGIVMTPGPNLLDYNVAADALGGGAAATLGTIGGAGPTVAGQNSWMRLQVAGAVRWIPIWA